MADKIPAEHERVRNTIRNWIVTERCKFTPSKGPNWLWGYNATKNDQGFSVFQISGRPESLFIGVTPDLIEYHQLFDSLSVEDQRTLVFDIRLALLNCDVESDVSDDLRIVRLLRQIFVEDNLTQTLFWDKIFSLHKALLVITFSVERRIPLQ